MPQKKEEINYFNLKCWKEENTSGKLVDSKIFLRRTIS
jgi:hypothetical protein